MKFLWKASRANCLLIRDKENSGRTRTRPGRVEFDQTGVKKLDLFALNSTAGMELL